MDGLHAPGVEIEWDMMGFEPTDGPHDDMSQSQTTHVDWRLGGTQFVLAGHLVPFPRSLALH